MTEHIVCLCVGELEVNVTRGSGELEVNVTRGGGELEVSVTRGAGDCEQIWQGWRGLY